jgi:hypothetical protein
MAAPSIKPTPGHTLESRFWTLEDNVEKWRPQFAMKYAMANRETKAELTRCFTEFEAAHVAFWDRVKELTTRPAAGALSLSDQADVIAATIAAVAKAKGGSRMPPDTLFAIAITHADPANREFIGKLSEPKLSGWMQQLPFQEKLKKEHNVVTFYVERDRCHRIVDLDWLTAHALIRRHVLDTTLRGLRCRFCRVQESDEGAITLIASKLEERHTISRDGAGRAIDVKASQGYVHEACLPTWAKWIGIAKRYETDEAAEAADLAAGRTSTTVPPLQEPEPAHVPEPEAESSQSPRDYYGTEDPGIKLPSEAVRGPRGEKKT